MNAARLLSALFLNATWVGNGRRIVASNLDFDSGRAAPAFRLSNDLLEIIGRDLRVSTAAHNSARFPLVSPPGMWRTPTGPQAGGIAGRLLDGGLFENYGAETALEILRAAEAVLGARFHPRVVLISSDPTLPADLAESRPGRPMSFGYELAALVAYSNTRGGHGVEAATRLRRWAQRRGGEAFAYFRMCREPGADGAPPPLGWALSPQARDTIAGYLPEAGAEEVPGCRGQNRGQLERVAGWLASPGGKASAGTARRPDPPRAE